jgi:hypothetical protein
MPPGLARIEPTLPQAHHAISVIENGQHLGVVALVLVQRPHGAMLRRPPRGYSGRVSVVGSCSGR